MTTEPIILTHIDCIPVWDEKGNEILLFDCYTKDGQWLGSRRLFRFVEQLNIDFPNIDLEKYLKRYIIRGRK